MGSWFTLYALMLAPGADAPGSPAVQPPLVGRPVDFSGAIGGPFTVQLLAEPTEVAVEEPLILTVRIIGPSYGRDIPRPKLAKLDAFKPFAVDDLDYRFWLGNPQRSEFRYRLRPRTADVKEVPRLKFVYFNPRMVNTPSHGYQTTYSDPVPLTVKPRTPPPLSVPAEVPAWMLEPMTEQEMWGDTPFLRWLRDTLASFGWSGIALGTPNRPLVEVWLAALVIPPFTCAAWYLLWRRTNPGEARLARVKRSRAAAEALEALQSDSNDTPHRVAQAIIRYLHLKWSLPGDANTTQEIAVHLAEVNIPAQLREQTLLLLRACDRDRFSGHRADDSSLRSGAERLILDWEAGPC